MRHPSRLAGGLPGGPAAGRLPGAGCGAQDRRGGDRLLHRPALRDELHGRHSNGGAIRLRGSRCGLPVHGAGGGGETDIVLNI